MLSTATVIDHRNRVNRVMMHINRCIDQEIRLDHLADLACYSPFHFIRIFEALMGETPQQYVIRKRMERAGYYLLKNHQRIIDIALDVGYETHNSFCKVFKAHFGISPKRFRDTSTKEWFFKASRFYHPVKAFGVRTTFQPLPIIKTLPPMKVIYIENRGILNGSFLTTANASHKRLMKKIVNHNLENSVEAFVSIYYNRVFSLEDKSALSLTGAIIDREVESFKDIAHCKFPSGRYAIFKHDGPREFMMQTWNKIFLNWLPGSGRRPRNAPTLEIYPQHAASNINARQLTTYLLLPIH